MTELAYMTWDEWAPKYEAIEGTSSTIRAWLGHPPYLFATTDARRYEEAASRDRNVVEHIAPTGHRHHVLAWDSFRKLLGEGDPFAETVALITPEEMQHWRLLSQLVEQDRVKRVFVLVFDGESLVRDWLDSRRAFHLVTGVRAEPADACLVEAARMLAAIPDLRNGRGKNAAVQLVRTAADAGHAASAADWLRAFFVAGGDFESARDLRRLIQEVENGVRHRVTRAYVDDIWSLIEERATAPH